MSEDGDGYSGNPGDTVRPELCLEYRKHMETKIENMTKNLSFTIKITGAIIALVLTIVQLGIFFFLK